METEFDTLLSKIYTLYYKAKASLAEAHLFACPKSYLEKNTTQIPQNIDVDILEHFVRRSMIYTELANKSWIIFVLEINKILSKGKSDRYSILKLYNKLTLNKLNPNISTGGFKQIMDIVNDKKEGSVSNKLKVLRDEHYAHSDNDFKSLTASLFPTFDKVWDLMNIIEDFLIVLYSQVDFDPVLDVDDKICDYIDEFKITYDFFKINSDFVEKILLEQAVGKVKAESYFNS